MFKPFGVNCPPLEIFRRIEIYIPSVAALQGFYRMTWEIGGVEGSAEGDGLGDGICRW
jgi:hypothetical protein